MHGHISKLYSIQNDINYLHITYNNNNYNNNGDLDILPPHRPS